MSQRGRDAYIQSRNWECSPFRGMDRTELQMELIALRELQPQLTRIALAVRRAYATG